MRENASEGEHQSAISVLGISQAMFILRLETFAPVTDDKAINAVSTLSVQTLEV